METVEEEERFGWGVGSVEQAERGCGRAMWAAWGWQAFDWG